jgi:hypothetical protein
MIYIDEMDTILLKVKAQGTNLFKLRKNIFLHVIFWIRRLYHRLSSSPQGLGFSLHSVS